MKYSTEKRKGFADKHIGNVSLCHVHLILYFSHDFCL